MNFDYSKQHNPNDCKHFVSWSEFVSWIETHQEPKNNGVLGKKRQSLNYPASPKWDAALGLSGALQMAVSGWAEGMEKAEAIAAPLVEKIVGQIERADIAYDVEGISIDIGRFLADDPECFVRLENEIVTSPCVSPRLITIAHNCTESANVSADSIIRKGAHVMALIRALEYAGHRVELTVIPYATDGAFCAVTVKQFDQPIDAALAIFALAHPAMLRRLGFIFAENMPVKVQDDAGSHYGYPRNPDSDADVKVDSRVGTLDMNWIIQELGKQGIRLTGRNGE